MLFRSPLESDKVNTSFNKGRNKESIAYSKLRDQLSKITLELRAESNEPSDRCQSKRRTRKDRRLKPMNNRSKIYKNKILSKLNRSQDAIKITENIVPKGLHLLKNLPLKTKAKNGIGNYTKENSKPGKMIIKPLLWGKKIMESQRHLARKYLGEVYSKIIFKVKDIERQKKMVMPLRSIKKVIEKCPLYRQDSSRLNSIGKIITSAKNKCKS